MEKERKIDSRTGYPEGRQKCGNTHLGKHRSKQPEMGGREQPRWVPRQEKARCGKSPVESRIRGRTGIVMVMGHVQEVEQSLTRNKFRKVKGERQNFQHAI